MSTEWPTPIKPSPTSAGNFFSRIVQYPPNRLFFNKEIGMSYTLTSAPQATRPLTISVQPRAKTTLTFKAEGGVLTRTLNTEQLTRLVDKFHRALSGDRTRFDLETSKRALVIKAVVRGRQVFFEVGAVKVEGIYFFVETTFDRHEFEKFIAWLEVQLYRHETVSGSEDPSPDWQLNFDDLELL